MDTSDREIIINSLIDAPRDVVWRAWTEPEQTIGRLAEYVTTME